MNRIIAFCFSVERAAGLASAILVALAGCQAGSANRSARFVPVSFDADRAGVRFTVQGDLARQLPTYRRVTRIEEFLYGPGDTAPPVVRNPQGMTLLGEELLVCDQGRPDIVAINLATGRARLWADPDHPPYCPVDVTASDTSVFVADTTAHAVIEYDVGGAFVGQLKPDDGGAFMPVAVLWHDGVLYVADIARRAVRRWDTGDRRWAATLAQAGSDLTLAAPVGLAMTADAKLLIADALRAVVFVAPVDGGAWTVIGSRGRGVGQLVRPKQVAVTRGGLVCVTDAGRQSVQVYDAGGGHVIEIHDLPNAWRGFTLPFGIIGGVNFGGPSAQAVAGAGDGLVVSDILGAPTLVAISVTEGVGEP